MKTRVELQELIDSIIYENTGGEISAERLNDLIKEIVLNVFNLEDDTFPQDKNLATDDLVQTDGSRIYDVDSKILSFINAAKFYSNTTTDLGASDGTVTSSVDLDENGDLILKRIHITDINTITTSIQLGNFASDQIAISFIDELNGITTQMQIDGYGDFTLRRSFDGEVQTLRYISGSFSIEFNDPSGGYTFFEANSGKIGAQTSNEFGLGSFFNLSNELLETGNYDPEGNTVNFRQTPTDQSLEMNSPEGEIFINNNATGFRKQGKLDRINNTLTTHLTHTSNPETSESFVVLTNDGGSTQIIVKLLALGRSFSDSEDSNYCSFNCTYVFTRNDFGNLTLLDTHEIINHTNPSYVGSGAFEALVQVYSESELRVVLLGAEHEINWECDITITMQ